MNINFQNLPTDINANPFYIARHESFEIIIRIIIENLYVLYDTARSKIIFTEHITEFINTDSYLLIDTDTLSVIIQDFYNKAREYEKLKLILNTQSNKYTKYWKFMYDACVFFFTPIRINVNSINDITKLSDLRRWLNIILYVPLCSPYIREYATNFIREHNYIDLLHGIITSPSAKEFLIKEKIKVMIPNIFTATTTNIEIRKSSIMIFSRCLTLLVSMLSIDCISYYCPYYSQIKRNLPTFTGKWLPYNDILLNEQLFFFKKINDNIIAS